MKIDKNWLAEKSACDDGVKWFLKQDETDGIKLVEKLIKEKIDWANWLVVRLMDRPQKVRYAIFAAEQVIKFFEKKYPKDKRPRNAIEAAKKWVADQSEENRDAASTAAYAADSAAAHAAASAAYAAAHAAASAAYAAAHAAYAADSAAAHAAAYAAYAAAHAAASAAYAAANAEAKMKEKIIRFGISFLLEKK